MALTSVMTVRIDRALHAALKERAKRLGRSTSAELLHLLRREISVVPRTGKPKRPSMGMFAHFYAPTLDEFAETRRANTTKVSRSLRATAKTL